MYMYNLCLANPLQYQVKHEALLGSSSETRKQNERTLMKWKVFFPAFWKLLFVKLPQKIMSTLLLLSIAFHLKRIARWWIAGASSTCKARCIVYGQKGGSKNVN